MKIKYSDLTTPEGKCPDCGRVFKQRRTDTRYLRDLGTPSDCALLAVTRSLCICPKHGSFYADKSLEPNQRYTGRVLDKVAQLSKTTKPNQIAQVLASRYNVVMSTPTVRRILRSD